MVLFRNRSGRQILGGHTVNLFHPPASGPGDANRRRGDEEGLSFRGGASRMPDVRTLIRAACLALALAVACAACSTAGSQPSRSAPPGADGRGAAITVGSFNFPESVLLAYLYADALAAKGYPVRVLPDLGTRELVDPALMAGLIQLVPEYTGSALDFTSLGRVHATASVAATARALERWMGERGIIIARPAPAQDGNAIV